MVRLRPGVRSSGPGQASKQDACGRRSPSSARPSTTCSRYPTPIRRCWLISVSLVFRLADPEQAPPMRRLSRRSRVRLFSRWGSMSWFGVEDGLWRFYREVWPRIVARCPAVTWTIAGPYASRAIQRLGDDPAITVTGYVDDIDSVIAGSRVAVIPLHIAGGVRIKLLELMARGRPSVATSIGAQGLAFADGEGCFRRDDPEGFANATVDLLRDDALTAPHGAHRLGVCEGAPLARRDDRCGERGDRAGLATSPRSSWR